MNKKKQKNFSELSPACFSAIVPDEQNCLRRFPVFAQAYQALGSRRHVPLIGARRRDQIAAACGARAVTLSREDLAATERAVPKGAAAGERYAPAQMAQLDSERP